MVRFLTAGESHGRALVVILEGIPAGLSIDIDAITRDLRRRQGGYGRGRRMAIESDRAEILVWCARRRNDRRPDRDDDREPRLGELAAHDADDGRAAAGCRRRAARAGDAAAPGPRRSRRRRQIWPRATSATSSNGRARARRPPASPPARWRVSCLRSAGVRITSHVFAIGSARLPDGSTRVVRRARPRSPDDAPLRCVDAGRRTRR